MRTPLVLGVFTATLALTAACGTNGFEGTLTNGLDGQPMADHRITAKAVGAVSQTCTAGETTTNAQGKFKFEKPCISDSDYTVKLADEAFWLAETSVVPQGTAAPVALVAWPHGGGNGVYKMAAGKTEPIKTSADLTSDKLLGTEEVVQYPKAVPGKIPLIAAGESLILNGVTAVDKTKFVPMFKTGPRKFNDAKNPSEITNPWWYLAVEFQSDTEWKRHEATLDSGKIKEHAHGDQKVRWVQAEALPAGRYALVTEGDRRISIVDILSAPAAE